MLKQVFTLFLNKSREDVRFSVKNIWDENKLYLDKMFWKTVSGILLVLLLIGMFTLAFNISLVKSQSSYLLPVPFHFQNTPYYCGPACLQMVFDYYGPCITQLEIAEVARTDTRYGGTFTDDMRRAGHFSNLSVSVGNEMPGNITGYSYRKIGYAAFEQWSMSIDDLKNLISHGYPVILLMWYDVPGGSGHFRVAVGYNETHIILHDPWNNVMWGGIYGGPNIAMNYSVFLEKWEFSGRWGLVTYPWSITLNYPTDIHRGDTFTITANITYPCPSPFPSNYYPASSVNATIKLSPGLNLAPGENPTKPLGNMLAGESFVTQWSVMAENFGNKTVNVEVEGKISGSVPSNEFYPGYTYTDRIGGSVNYTIPVLGFIHDLSVANVHPLKVVVGQGLKCKVQVNVKNKGEFTETFNVTLYANETIAGFQTLTNLPPEENATLTFLWDTTNQTTFPKGNYTISAYIHPVQGETNIIDNLLIDGIVKITIAGDINGDNIVDIFDLVQVASSYGSTSEDPNWNIYADLNGDGVVDIFDLVIVASHYGETIP